MSEKTKLYVISHTHWDREWYETFQQYRYRLIQVLDDVLMQLENHPEFPVFHLDGQTIPLEDYLEIRPENRERLEALIKDGRIVIGPWYVMPDEFLVSGEALIKNLATGYGICADYGVEPMKNGYVTDIFGHNSQFPQILQGFGIESALLYRGAADYEKDLFSWKAPDGSTVTVAKMDRERCYSNFYFAVRWPYEEKEFDPDDAVARMEKLIPYWRSQSAGRSILLMDGVDHIGIGPNVPKMLRLFEERIPDVEFIHCTLEQYFEDARREGLSLDTIKGPLYHPGEKGVNNQVLKNVLSSMVHLKQENDRCERQLTSFAEPLNVFAGMVVGIAPGKPVDNPSFAPRRRYLDTAWKYLLKNQPHDSICGCSVSDVHRDNEYRFRQAIQIGEVSTQDCLREIGSRIKALENGDGSVLLYNPSQYDTADVILCTLDVKKADGNPELYGPDGQRLPFQILQEEEEQVHVSGVRRLITFETVRRLHAAVPVSVPAFGYTMLTWRLAPPVFVDVEKKGYTLENWKPVTRLTQRMQVSHNTFDNGVLRLAVNAGGTLDITDKRTGKQYHDLLVFEDAGDVGEGWNYRKPQYDRIRLSDGCRFSWEVCSDGDYALVLKLVHHFFVPERTYGQERSGRDTCLVLETTVTLLKDSDRVVFHTKTDNTAEDHRLRVLFPSGLQTDVFYTKTPFDMQKWDVSAGNYADWIETETFVHPSQGVTFISDGTDSMTLSTRGLYEAEVTDNEERALALTLYRAFRVETGTTHSGDGEMKRRLQFDYTLAFGDESPAAALAAGEIDRTGLFSLTMFNPSENGTLPAEHSFLRVSSNAKQVSNIFAGEDGKTANVRLYDVSGIAEDVTLTFAGEVEEAWLQKLDGTGTEALAVCKNQVTIPCGAHKIVTVGLRLADSLY